MAEKNPPSNILSNVPSNIHSNVDNKVDNNTNDSVSDGVNGGVSSDVENQLNNTISNDSNKQKKSGGVQVNTVSLKKQLEGQLEGQLEKQLEKQIIALKNDIAELKQNQHKAYRRYEKECTLKPYQAELITLQNYLETTKKRMIIIFEGRDASGKGGTIRRITRYMNEKHYRNVALGKPTAEQCSQWYFQRYITQFPQGGEMVLFDRSWYNRAMVEPVLGFCTPEEYKNFIKGVVGFEKDLVRQDTILIKFYFSVTKGEQAKRFERRTTDPLRQWKLSEVDIQAQKHWDEFTNAKYEMLKRSHTSAAPWTIIRSNDKHAARLNVLRVILNNVSYENKNPTLDYVPNPKIVISGAREIEIMELDRLNKGKFKA